MVFYVVVLSLHRIAMYCKVALLMNFVFIICNALNIRSQYNVDIIY